MIESRNSAENPNKNYFYKTFVNIPNSSSGGGFEGLYKRVKRKTPSNMHGLDVKSKLKENILASKLFEAKWDKSSRISIAERKNSNFNRSCSQPLFNFLYSRNYYDYRSDAEMLFTKSSLRELLTANYKETCTDDESEQDKVM